MEPKQTRPLVLRREGIEDGGVGVGIGVYYTKTHETEVVLFVNRK